MFVQPFEFPILNKRVIVLEKNPHKSRNNSQKQGMNIRLNIFGDYNNKFGVLTRNMSAVNKEDDDHGKKKMFNPGFHNKLLCNLFKRDKKEEKEVLFSRIYLRKQHSTVVLNSDIGKHKASENNINIHHQHKHKKKKAVSIITDRKHEELLIRNLYLSSNSNSNNEHKRDIKTLLTVKKIPKEIFRNTLQLSPKVTFNNRMLKYFNSHSINNSNTLISTNEYFKRK